MYDITVIGCPSFDRVTRNSIKNPIRSLSGPAVTTALTVSKLGIENMVIIGSISNEFSDQLVLDFDNLGIPEYYKIDSPETGGFEIECNDGEDPIYVARRMVRFASEDIGLADVRAQSSWISKIKSRKERR